MVRILSSLQVIRSCFHLCAVAGTSIGCFRSLSSSDTSGGRFEDLPILICRSFLSFFFLLSCHLCDCVRLRISPSGQCTTIEDGGWSHEEDEAAKEIAVEQRKLSAQRLALGKFTGTLQDKVFDAYLWLMRQSKGKNIKADKVCLNSPAALQHSVSAQDWMSERELQNIWKVWREGAHKLH